MALTVDLAKSDQMSISVHQRKREQKDTLAYAALAWTDREKASYLVVNDEMISLFSFSFARL